MTLFQFPVLVPKYLGWNVLYWVVAWEAFHFIYLLWTSPQRLSSHFLRGRLIFSRFMEKFAVSLLKVKRLRFCCKLSHIWRMFFFCTYGGGKKKGWTISIHRSAVTFSAESACLRVEREGNCTIFRQGSQEQTKAQYMPWPAPRAFAWLSRSISIV